MLRELHVWARIPGNFRNNSIIYAKVHNKGLFLHMKTINIGIVIFSNKPSPFQMKGGRIIQIKNSNMISDFTNQ